MINLNGQISQHTPSIKHYWTLHGDIWLGAKFFQKNNLVFRRMLRYMTVQPACFLLQTASYFLDSRDSCPWGCSWRFWWYLSQYSLYSDFFDDQQNRVFLWINFDMNTLVRTPLPYKRRVTIVPITAGDTIWKHLIDHTIGVSDISARRNY